MVQAVWQMLSPSALERTLSFAAPCFVPTWPMFRTFFPSADTPDMDLLGFAQLLAVWALRRRAALLLDLVQRAFTAVE